MKIRRLLPRRIFFRFIYINILPIIFILLCYTCIVYDYYVKTNFIKSRENLFQNIILLNNVFDKNKQYQFNQFKINFDIGAKIKKQDIFQKNIIPSHNKIVKILNNQLFNNIEEDFSFVHNKNQIILSIQKQSGVLNIFIKKKNIICNELYKLILYNILCVIIISIINYLFIKNQLKPLKVLIKHIRNFSLEKKNIFFKPFGAKEIRELTSLIFNLEIKIQNSLNKYKIFFNGIIHDLMVPLTRINVELKFLDQNKVKYIKNDIEYISTIIQQYNDYTQNKIENKSYVNIYDYISNIVKSSTSNKNKIFFKITNLDKREVVFIQTISFKRVIQNLLDNAFNYGKHISLTLKKKQNKIFIKIDNDGNLSNDELEKIKNIYFNDIKNKLNSGFSIIKNILSHNDGDIEFKKSKLGGLSVIVNLNIL